MPGAAEHPSPLVESAAMAAVRPPTPSYQPHLSRDLIDGGKKLAVHRPDGGKVERDMGLSEAGLESVVYAGQAHQRFLPAAEGEKPARRGWFLGDGTGAGKGRQIGGIISDNINQGRKKHVWISEKWPLTEDARRDLADVGVHPDTLVPWDELEKGGFSHPEGIAFVTYSTLRSGGKKDTDEKNVDKLIRWLGPDFDGVISFDESHALANASSVQGSRGKAEPSQQAIAGLKLQQALPNARVVYVSATGATEVRNLAYAERLGLWGRGTPFADRDDFVTKIAQGGTAAMEATAQSMKAMGMYSSRSLAMSDGTDEGSVQFDRLPHTLTDEQKYIHKNLSEAWQHVLKRIDDAIEATTPPDKRGNPIKKNNAQRTNALSQFWGANQRFWNQVLTSMQTPSVVNSIEGDLKAGRAPVVSLVNTMEAVTKRKLAARGDDEEIEELDLSPKEILAQFVKNSFPVHRQEKYEDENGNVLVRVALGQDGNPLVDPAAAAMRDELLEKVHELRIPESPLDMVLKHFGHDNVAEVTGRTVRVVHKPGEDGRVKAQAERRDPQTANTTEADAFQQGRKKILVFSDAGGTGRSYHADRTAANQGRRVHYMLQPGWRADKAVQALGRTHRTNQTSAPLVKLVEIPEVPGQRRFISTIARRLAQLGALTKGERKAGGGGLFQESDNLEHPLAQEALNALFTDMEANRVPGLDYGRTLEQLGIAEPTDEDRRRRTQRAPVDMPVPKFLNRLLSVDLGTQKQLMDALETRIQSKFEQAKLAGDLDTGVEDFNANTRAERVTKDSERVVFTDPETGATVRHIQATARRKTLKRTWAELHKGRERPEQYVLNNKSGRTWAVYPAANRTDARTGRVIERFMLRGPTSDQAIDRHQLMTYVGGPYTKLADEDAKAKWAAEHKAAPDHTDDTEHFIAGAMLPVWDRLPDDRPKIYRVRMHDGESMVARHIPESQVDATLEKLGAGQEKGAEGHDPADLHRKLAAGNHQVHLANGWRIHPAMVQGERRIEVTGPTGMHADDLAKDGVFRESINYTRRYFVPTGKEGEQVLARLTKHRPVAKVEGLGKGSFAPA